MQGKECKVNIKVIRKLISSCNSIIVSISAKKPFLWIRFIKKRKEKDIRKRTKIQQTGEQTNKNSTKQNRERLLIKYRFPPRSRSRQNSQQVIKRNSMKFFCNHCLRCHLENNRTLTSIGLTQPFKKFFYSFPFRSPNKYHEGESSKNTSLSTPKSQSFKEMWDMKRSTNPSKKKDQNRSIYALPIPHLPYKEHVYEEKSPLKGCLIMLGQLS